MLRFESGFEENKEIYDHLLKFTLTWKEEYVYVTTNNRQLQVFRLPLYKSVEKREAEWEKTHGICENEGIVFLPQSTEDRNVYFFPTQQGASPNAFHRKQKTRKSHGGGEDIVATVVLSSKVVDRLFPSSGQSAGELGKGSLPPQVLYLTAAQLGAFTAVKSYEHSCKELKRVDSFKGGQLLAMFEKIERCGNCGRVTSAGFDLEAF
jgi:hypothetical protein